MFICNCKGNLRLISVILSAENSQIRFDEARKYLIMDLLIMMVYVWPKGEEIQEVNEKGLLEKMSVITEALHVMVKKGEDSEMEKW